MTGTQVVATTGTTVAQVLSTSTATVTEVAYVQNSITNTWVRDVYSKRQYSIPNYLTPRVFNLRLGMRF